MNIEKPGGTSLEKPPQNKDEEPFFEDWDEESFVESARKFQPVTPEAFDADRTATVAEIPGLKREAVQQQPAVEVPIADPESRAWIEEHGEVASSLVSFKEAVAEARKGELKDQKDPAIDTALDSVIAEIKQAEPDFQNRTRLYQETGRQTTEAWGHDPLVADSVASRYMLGRLLGRGGDAEVFSARHVLAPEGVRDAVKFIRPDALDPEQRQRFKKEMKLLASINHPNVLKVHHGEVVTDSRGQEVGWYAVPELAGASVESRLKEGEEFSIEDSLKIAYQTAAGLEAIHQAGLVHRDIKPDNLLLEEEAGEQVVRIADFGIAQIAREEQEKEEKGERVKELQGSPKYMSPEQADMLVTTDKSDVFSLGSTLFKVITGEDAFYEEGDNILGVAAKILTEEPVDEPKNLRPDIPQALNDLILQMLQKDPDNRPSAAEVKKSLKKLLPRAKAADIAKKFREHEEKAGERAEPAWRAEAKEVVREKRERGRKAQAEYDKYRATLPPEKRSFEVKGAKKPESMLSKAAKKTKGFFGRLFKRK